MYQSNVLQMFTSVKMVDNRFATVTGDDLEALLEIIQKVVQQPRIDLSKR